MTDSPSTSEETPSDAGETSEKKDWGQIFRSEAKFFSGLAAFLLVFYTTIFGHFKIPSESMQPTLEVGDHLYVSKFAYGYSRHSFPLGLHKLPFLGDGKIFARLPKRGDVVVYRNPKDPIVMIKRVVGLPGDEIEMRSGRLFLNGELVDRKPVDAFSYREHKGYVVDVDVYSEQWPGEEQPHLIYEQTDAGPLDNVGPFSVPQGMVFFMGDNRDNSVDSRAPNGPGLVPEEYLIGRADLMMFSFKRCKKEDGLYCPPIRFLKGL